MQEYINLHLPPLNFSYSTTLCNSLHSIVTVCTVRTAQTTGLPSCHGNNQKCKPTNQLFNEVVPVEIKNKFAHVTLTCPASCLLPAKAVPSAFWKPERATSLARTQLLVRSTLCKE